MSYNLSQIGSRLRCILKYITNILLINRNTNKYKNIEKLELEILQYRKSVNEPENYDEKIQEEKEMAEWLGQESFTIKPLTPEEERRLEYLLTIYNDNKSTTHRL
jgi:sporulation-control protein spo0M